MKFLISIICFSLFVVSLNCQSFKNLPEFTAPIQITDNRPFVEVKIKEKKLYFVIDTGGFNLIDTDRAKELGLELSNPSRTSGAGEQTVEVWRTTIESFSIGDKTFNNQQFNVLSLKNIKDGLNLPYLDGIIGYDFFGSLVLQIDYPNQKFSILNNYTGKNGTPFSIYGSHIPKLKVEIDGIESEFVLDTGDRSQLTLSKNFSKQILEKAKYELSEEKITGYGIGGAILANTFELISLQVGSVGFEKVLTRIPNVKSGAFAQSSFNGSIGSGLLRKYKVTFDYPNNLIYFE